MAHPTVAVLEWHLRFYRRLWKASAFSAFVLPLLFLLGIGVGVGGYVGELEDADYLTWIVPGVLASTAFQIAIGECTYGVLGGFQWWSGNYNAMHATPVRIRDMIAGWLAFMVFRVGIAVLAFLAVVALFGAVRSPWALAAPLVCALLTLAVAAPTTAFSATVETDTYFQLLFRLVMIPSTLFAGVFFPVERLPEAVRPLVYASPLWHAVELDRAAMLGGAPAWPVAAHVGYLLAFAAGGTAWALWAFRRRLQA